MVKVKSPGVWPLNKDLLRALPHAPRCRFAPSPTGFLHLGHLASALCVFAVTRALGGQVLLRIEDHDRGRCRQDYEKAILEDLAWLGLKADNHEQLLSDKACRFRQSDNQDAYRAALEKLKRAGHLYACRCSRKDIQVGRSKAVQPPPATGELYYPGTCRDSSWPLSSPPYGLRFMLPPQSIDWQDLLCGHYTETPADQCGDLLLQDRQGNWTYQFAVVVDDLDQGIDLVVRGQDLLPSTARQIQLGTILGRSAPAVFLHHPLLLDEHGQKLGKRFFSTGLGQQRAQGQTPEALLGQALFGLRVIHENAPCSLEQALGIIVQALGLR